MKIKELCEEEKFFAIINFLEANKIYDVDQLDDFDLDELYFIPKVEEKDINSFIDAVDNYKKSIHIQESDKENGVMSEISMIEYIENVYNDIEDKEAFKKLYVKFKQDLGKFENKYQLNINNVHNTIVNVFKEFPKGMKFIEYCKLNNWEYLEDLRDFDFDNTKIKGIGTSSLQRIGERYREIMNDKLDYPTIEELLEKVHNDNYYISCKLLGYFGLNESIIMKYNLLNLNIEDLKDIKFDYADTLSINYVLHKLEVSLFDYFEHVYNDRLKDKYKEILLLRSKGNTLDDIGNQCALTRERVRQICVKASEIIGSEVDLVLSSFIKNNKEGVSGEIVERAICDKNLFCVIKEVAHNSKIYCYLENIDKFLDKNLIPKNFFKNLAELIKSLITNGINYCDLVGELDSFFESQEFFKETDLKFYLLSLGYAIAGDIVYKGRIPYSKIAFDIVNKYFEYDIKLDSDENNEDMMKLRAIMKKNYGIEYDSNNRSLTSVIVRDTQAFVLTGRGRYCPINRIECSMKVLEKIKDDIYESGSSTIYYSDIYERNKVMLNNESSIDNYNFLHGMLMYYYPEEFEYSRDFLIIQGQTASSIDEQILLELKNRQKSMTFEEIHELFPSINKLRLSFLIERNEELIPWGVNSYNSILNLHEFPKDTYNLLLEKLLNDNNAYLSSVQLYEYFYNYENNYIISEAINNDRSLFYIFRYYFKDVFDFKYPHISKKGVYKNLSAANVILKQTMKDGKLNWNDIYLFSKKVKWRESTTYSIMDEITSSFIKISRDDYIKDSYFKIGRDQLDKIQVIISEYVAFSGFYSLNSINNYDSFPDIGWQWNSFLLESIVEKYLNNFTIIKPLVKDRRYQKSVLVRKDLNINDFGDLIVHIMKKEEKNKYSRSELLNLLSRYDINYSNIPQEIYGLDKIKYNNELFILKE